MVDLPANEGRNNIQRQSKTQQSQRIPLPGHASNLNQHLNRVMRLIEQREQVQTENESESPHARKKGLNDCLTRNASTALREGAGTVADRSSMKRSMSAMSYEENNTTKRNAPITKQDAEAAKDLGKLRIVKSIHTKILHQTSFQNQHNSVKDADTDEHSSVLQGTSAAHSQILTPQMHRQENSSDEKHAQPLGFFKQGGQSQKRSLLCGGTSDLMLQGKVKPKNQRSNVARRTSYMPKRIRSRENSCQTTPPCEGEDSQDADAQKEIDVAEVVSTQKATLKSQRENDLNEKNVAQETSSNRVENSKESYQRSRQSNMKVTASHKEPSKKVSQNSCLQVRQTSNNKTQAHSVTQKSHQQQRLVKMSLLRQDQAKAGQFLMYQQSEQPGSAAAIHSEYDAMDHTSTAFNSASGSRSSYPTTNNKLHTALRMNKRTNRQRTHRLQMAEADRKNQVFSSDVTLGNQQQRQFLSGRNSIQQMQQKEVVIPKHIKGAFQDHDTSKAFFDKDMNRSHMRQDYMNKTQTFFPSASHKDRKGGKKAGLVEIEDVMDYTRHKADKNNYQQNRQFKFKVGRSDDEAETGFDVKQMFGDDHLLNGSSDANSSGGSLEKYYYDSMLIKGGLESEEGAASVVIDQSWPEQFNSFSTSVQHATRKQSQQPNTSMLLLEKQYKQQMSLYSSTNGIQLPSKLAVGQRSSTQAGQRSSLQYLKSSQGTTAPGTINQAKSSIEKRLLNQIERDLDTNEQAVYEKHGMADQIIFSAKETRLYDLIEHPEWSNLTEDMHKVYLKTLEEFNTQLIGQNYFIRGSQINASSTKSVIKSQQQTKTVPAPNRTPKTAFLTKWVKRLSNLLNQHSFLLKQSKQKLSDLVDDNKRLKDEVSKLRSERLIVHDQKHVINELVNQFFANGNDKDLKNFRLLEAEKFLQSESMEEIIASEPRDTTTQHLDYSNTLQRLQEIIMHMSQPISQDKGNQFDINEYVFDPHFQDKIRNLFSSRIAEAQYDSAFRSLKIVHKESNTVDIGIQASPGEIDHDIAMELKFYKGETARLQAEMNSQKVKMVQHERSVKTAAKEKNDAQLGSSILHTQIQDLRQDIERLKNSTMQYKQQHQKAAAESESHFINMNRIQVTLDRTVNFGRSCERLFEKMFKIDTMKDVVCKEQGKLLDVVAPKAGKEIMKKFMQIQKFQVKVEEKNNEMKKYVADYRATQFESSKTVVNAPPSKANKLRAQMNVSDMETDRRPAATTGMSGKQTNEHLDILDNKLDHSRADSRSSASRSNSRMKNSKVPGKLGKKAVSKDVSLGLTKENAAAKGITSAAKKGKKGAKKGGMRKMNSTSPDQRAPSVAKQGGIKAKVTGKKSRMVKMSTQSKEGLSMFDDEDAEDSDDEAIGSVKVADFDEEDSKDADKDSFASCFDDESSEEKDNKAHSDMPMKNQSNGSISISIKEAGRAGTNLSLVSSRKIGGAVRDSTNSGRHSTKRFSPGEANDYAPMTPMTSKIPENITINRNQIDKKIIPTMKDQSLQTDTELFFQYIFDFLGELERRIEKGDINVEEILRLGGGPNLDFSGEDDLNDDLTSHKTNEKYQQHTKVTNTKRVTDDATKRKIDFSVQELKECLRRLQGLACYGGDIFFTGIARSMVAKPFIPHSFKLGLSVPHQEEKSKEQEPSQSVLNSQKKRLREMTRINTSQAGGGGPVRDSPPSKAYRAATRQSSVYDESPFQLRRKDYAAGESQSRSPSPIEFALRSNKR